MSDIRNPKSRYFVSQRGPYYFEIRDSWTGYHVGVRVGANAREAAEREAARRNAAAA